MSKGKTPIAQTYYKFSNVKSKAVNTSLDYTNKAFTYLKSMRYATGMELISVNDLGQLINNYSNANGGKLKDRCLLKGLYENNFNGVDCIKNGPYLFFDIDVKSNEKKKENAHILHHDLNQIIFNELEKISVICWRSNSGNGIAGVLYVPQLANYLNKDKDLHLQAGKEITKHLSNYLNSVTGIDPIEFDNAQSKFRQVRFLAEQKEKRQINKKPFEFTYEVKEKTKELSPGVIAYKTNDYKKPYGTITGQFDNDNDILTIAQNNGFSIVGSDKGNEIRIHHPLSTSQTSGTINRALNVFFNFSSSLSQRKSFTPSQMVCEFEYKHDWNNFHKHLTALNYKEKQTPKEEIKDVSKALLTELINVTNEAEASEIIFKHCYDLQTLSNEQKQSFIKENCPRPELKKFFVAYLNLIDYKIEYDKDFIIDNYVSEKLKNVLNYVDQYKNVILRAETGKGKTTAFIRDFHKHRPKSRLLILVPLTIISEQNKKEYQSKGIFLDGKSTPDDHKRAQNEKLVFATYEQGVKLLNVSKFDYIVIDEVHQLITANDFRKVISELTQLLNNSKIIGLTGTPTAIFKNLGYKLLNVDVKNPKQTKVEIRFLNNKPFNIALSHIRQSKGKVLLRLNDIEAIEALKKQLIAVKLLKSSEVLVLHSSKQIKASKDFKQLAHNRTFNDKIKLVLTTSLIDEGLSINQTGFTDIVFIETNYNPRPEAIKQFFARFRNEDPNRKNYLYLRTTNDQTPTRYNPEYAYNDTFKRLQIEIDENNGNELKSTYKSIFSNDVFFHKNNTINHFYLAYSITGNLFKLFNIEQFINYLESNYNLELTKSLDFEFNTGNVSIEKAHRKEVKQLIANAWIFNKDEVLQALGLHSLNSSIRRELTANQCVIDPKTEQLVIAKIKYFEKLYNQYSKLKILGVDEPNSVLIDNKDGITLASEKKYKDEITLLTLYKKIFEPKNEADKVASKRVVDFAEWCKTKKEFSHNQMIRKLKELRVYKNEAYSINRIIIVLKWFELNAKKDTNTQQIKVS